MNRRIQKKRIRKFINRFTKDKLPLAFPTEKVRREYVSAWVRRQMGQSYHFPATFSDGVDTYKPAAVGSDAGWTALPFPGTVRAAGTVDSGEERP